MGERKSAYLKLAGAAQQTRGDIGKYRGEIGGWRTGELQPQRAKIEAQRTAPRPDVELARREYTNIINNPAARGYDAATLNRMRGVQSDVSAGQRGSYLKDMRRQVQAQGLGNTGTAIRNLNQYTEGNEARTRAAFRDIDIANAQQGRGEYLEAVKSMPGLQSMEDAYNQNMFQLQNQVLGQEANAYQLQGATFPMETQTMQPELEATQGAYRPGFWGQLGSSLAQGIGSGVAGLISGGVSGGGFALGQRAGMGGGGGGATGGMGSGIGYESGSAPYGSYPGDYNIPYYRYGGGGYR
jgi:hypothetical protein